MLSDGEQKLQRGFHSEKKKDLKVKRAWMWERWNWSVKHGLLRGLGSLAAGATVQGSAAGRGPTEPRQAWHLEIIKVDFNVLPDDETSISAGDSERLHKMAGPSDKARFYLENSVSELNEFERKKIFTRVRPQIILRQLSLH